MYQLLHEHVQVPTPPATLPRFDPRVPFSKGKGAAGDSSSLSK